MSTRQASIFDGQRLQMSDSIRMTIESLTEYGQRYQHWAIAWSGGKDSSTLVTLVIWLVLTGQVSRPRTITVCYADTRLELLPLAFAAAAIRDELGEHAEALAAIGVHLDVRVVMAPLDKRFMVYMLGRGVPPPNNNTLRWCTQSIKIDPMAAELRVLAAERWTGLPASDLRAITGGWRARTVRRDDPAPSWERATALATGAGVHEKVLMLTGVRLGESAVRDGRIATSCSRDGAECGQGWYQESLPASLCDTLAPLLHWRVCHVWEWLRHWAPLVEFGDWSTEVIAEAYGGDEAEEVNARTGCTGCPLANRDTALETMLARPAWSYLAPLKELKPLYRELRKPKWRLRKRGREKLKGGGYAANPQRMGPLTFAAREMALATVLGIQRRCNEAAVATGRPLVDLIDPVEEARIRELIALKTWPEKWTGEEPTGDVMLPVVYADGHEQPLFSIFGG
jgi:DNA sulfur modification protein DndC